jgi:hypothetical protein
MFYTLHRETKYVHTRGERVLIYNICGEAKDNKNWLRLNMTILYPDVVTLFRRIEGKATMIWLLAYL